MQCFQSCSLKARQAFLASCAPKLHAALQGGLPGEWGYSRSVPALHKLDLSSNYQVSESIPEAWGSGIGLQNLTELHLRSCNLMGSLPTSWATKLPNLSILDITDNNMSGMQQSPCLCIDKRSAPPPWNITCICGEKGRDSPHHAVLAPFPINP